MDALKKAEQEKREAARKLEESGAGATMDGGTTDQHPVESGADATLARPMELSLEPVSGEFSNPPAADADATIVHDLPALNMSGEHLLSMDLNTSQPMPQAPPAPSGHVAELVQDAQFDGDMTFQGLDARPAAPAPAVPGMFEETVAGDTSLAMEGKGYDETLPGVSALQMARDIGTRDQPTPVAAETVFTAGSRKEGTGGAIKWALGGLTVVMLGAAVAWYYLAVTPVARNVPSPWVARGIESLPAAQPGAVPGPVLAGEIPGAVPVPEALGEPVPVPAGDAEAAGSLPAVPVPDIAAAPVAEPAPAASEPVTPAPVTPAPEPVPVAATVPAITAVAPSLVRVSRSTEPAPVERMVREAYGSYQAGDFAGARELYGAVLDDDPDNLDALLGIGAIALREGDTAAAVAAHGHVLRLDPDNGSALAVLVGLNKSADLNAAASAIQTLMQKNPEHAFLHFTLGNIYAAQQRWPEAQQAFFDAHRIDSANPDYALNLAVSLDRMGQRQPALDYYGTALRLAEQNPSGFDPASILARIQSLSSDATP